MIGRALKVSIVALLFPTAVRAVEMQLIGAPSLSADGETLVFEWLSDLWLAPATGGEAIRVEEDPGRDTFPKFTRNSERIVFSSDRTGSMQVFSIPVGGGAATQHTFHSEGNELECLSPDGGHALVRGLREGSGLRETRLMTINLTRDEREQRLFDASATSADWSPDGTQVLFCRGGEQLFRKGYKGSRASQIWHYDTVAKVFTPVVAEETDARSPMWLPDGTGFYYISSRSGTANLWFQPDDATSPTQLTHFSGDGVNWPTLSADGTAMVFRKGLEVFHWVPWSDKPPQPVRFRTKENVPESAHEMNVISKAAASDFNADLDQVVSAAAGELWWLQRPGAAAVQLTKTAAAEGGPVFSPDGKWLYFSRDDGLAVDFFRCQLGEAGLENETQITRSARSKGRFKLSPDGSRIAWMEGTGDVFTAAADGSKPKCVFKCWDAPTFDWSPCGHWLSVAAIDKNVNRDIWLTAADGGREPVNLTRHPAFEGSPRWSRDGRWLVFSARRDAGGKLELWKIDFGKKGIRRGLEGAAIAQLGGKAKRIPLGELEPVRTIWTADSKALLFQNSKRSDEMLYSVDVSSHAVTPVSSQRGVPIRTTRDGSLLWQVDQTPSILRNGESLFFPLSATLERPRREMLTLAFRRIWRTLGERYYDPTMSGRDWPALRLKYEAVAASARSSRQFDHVISQLYGELNASHLSFLRKPWNSETTTKTRSEEPTAHPGLIFTDGEPEGPLRIERLIAGSPVALLPQAPRRREIVVKIAGENVTSRSPLHRYFNGAENRPLPMVVRAADGSERVIELRGISYSKARSLARQERESFARKLVSLSGKICYLVVPNMNHDTIMALEQQVYECSLESDGLILDLRNNGGGREADRMLAMFCQPIHSFTVPRGGPEGYPQARRLQAFWSKPMVVLCNQNTYSNSEIFCHAIQQAGRAPLVGTTTAGGVISAIKTTIPDAGELQVPFRGWYHAGTGTNLELNGAKPDYPVSLTPADEQTQRDPQLLTALEVLKKAMAEDSRGER